MATASAAAGGTCASALAARTAAPETSASSAAAPFPARWRLRGLGLANLAALPTPLGIGREPPLCVALLVFHRVSELLAAILTQDHFVFEIHYYSVRKAGHIGEPVALDGATS